MATAMASSASATASSTAFLHPRLMNFFIKYPPKQYGAYFTGQSIPTIKQKIAVKGNKKTGEGPTATSTSTQADSPAPTPSMSSSTVTDEPAPISIPTATTSLPNPFLPYRNPATGHWRGATYGLRRQSDLFKLAREYGVEQLLPPSIKSSQYKQQRALERGLAVKGTGLGESVKGHKWERQLPKKIEMRVKAMEGMDEMIREWKMRGHGRGWKKYPK